MSVQKSEKDKANKELISTVALPAFIKNTQFKGDFRLRYEFNDRETKKKTAIAAATVFVLAW